jgi:hypothetical protein
MPLERLRPVDAPARFVVRRTTQMLDHVLEAAMFHHAAPGRPRDGHDGRLAREDPSRPRLSIGEVDLSSCSPPLIGGELRRLRMSADRRACDDWP